MGTTGSTADPPRKLPRGPHQLDPELVAASQRVRMLDSVIELVAERGYPGVRVADVIDRAGVSRKTFYEHFDNKESCFLAAFDHCADLLDRAIIDATTAADNPADRLDVGYRALLGTLAARPSLARVFVVHAPGAGPAAQARRSAWLEASVHRLRMLFIEASAAAGSERAELPDYVARAIVGAVEALVAHHVETRQAETLDQLVPTAVDIARQLMFADIASPD